MNIVTPRGQNEFKGSANYSFQPMDWNSDNTKAARRREAADLAVGEPVDMSLGGRLVRDKVWFFPPTAMRISRTASAGRRRTWRPDGVQADLRAFRQLLEEQAAVRQDPQLSRIMSCPASIRTTAIASDLANAIRTSSTTGRQADRCISGS